jgi:hypothetical protein
MTANARVPADGPRAALSRAFARPIVAMLLNTDMETHLEQKNIRTLKLLLLFLILITWATGCNRVHSVTKEELRELVKQSQGADKTALYYKGSSDKYDYFVLITGKSEKSYRVAYGNVYLPQRFPPSEDRNRWVIASIK